MESGSEPSCHTLIARAPLRISLAGGGTDLPAYYERYGGMVVSTTIDKFVYVHCGRNGKGDGRDAQITSANYTHSTATIAACRWAGMGTCRFQSRASQLWDRAISPLLASEVRQEPALDHPAQLRWR